MRNTRSRSAAPNSNSRTPAPSTSTSHNKSQTQKRGLDTEDSNNEHSKASKKNKRTKQPAPDSSTATNDQVVPNTHHSSPTSPRVSPPPAPATVKDLDQTIRDDIEEFDRTVNIDTWGQVARQWTGTRVKALIDGRKKYASRIPSEVISAAKIARANYRKAKLMLAGIAKVKLETLDRELGEGAVPRGQDDFRRFMAYGKDSLKLRMPNNPEQRMVLAERNKKAGRLWTEVYTRQQRNVFNSKFFFALAGIPNTQEADDKEPPAEGSAPKVPSLTPEEEAQYRPLYDELVAHEKVIEQQGRPTSDKDINKRSLKRVRQLGKILARDGDRLSFKYVFLASSAHPPAANSGAGWSRQFTSVPAITKWADREIGLSPVFATVAQGESMINAITRNHNRNDKKSKGPSTHAPQPSDILKTTLANTLKERMIATLGYCPTRGKGFPLTADPVAGLVKRKVPVRIVQEPGSKLSAEDLKVGHKAMPKVNRQEWLDDLISNHFRLELVEGVEKSASKSGENQQVGGSKGKGKRASKIKSKDIVSDDEEEEEVDEDEEEEEEDDDCIDDDDDDDNDDDDDDGNGDELDDDDDN